MFTYKGIKARDMNLSVINDVTFTSPERDVNLIQVAGRDGDLVMDNGRFSSVVRAIPCQLKADKGEKFEQAIHKVNNWLINDGKFHDFEWDNDPNFIYQAKVDGGVGHERLIAARGRTVINFRLHPVKFLKNSLNEVQIESGLSVMSPFEIEAKPILRIVGNGNITLSIGGRPLVLRGITGGCIIDSENQVITDLQGRVTLFDRMYNSSFPVLRPGSNVVTFPEGVQVFMTPRLGALV